MRLRGLLLAFLPLAAQAPRQPVMAQVAHPHPYYWRGLYLPQVTTGATSPSWTPDGKALVFAKEGSLWRQELSGGPCIQLTAGPGYDHQPDVSPDGRSVVFTREVKGALELHLLDLASGRVRPLTAAGAVNLEPRWSPDGRKLAWVSTEGDGHFHLAVGEVPVAGLLRGTRLTPEHRAAEPRYYYGPVDHELSPTWTRDGRALLAVTNRDTPHGTGGLWRIDLSDPAHPVRLHEEETNWQARPDVAPDGKRLAFASYAGRAWHQLWVLPVEGGHAFPLTYGDFDAREPRWSPDGQRLAYGSTESGTPALWIFDFAEGGRRRAVTLGTPRFLRPTGTLLVRVEGPDGHPHPARLALRDATGRTVAPDGAWLAADDSVDPTRTEPWRSFPSQGEVRLTVAAGPVRATAWFGLKHQVAEAEAQVPAGGEATLVLRPAPLDLPAAFAGWRSTDVHLHMNYGGAYRNTPEHFAAQAAAEDLDLAWNLVVNKEQRVPDQAAFHTGSKARALPRVALDGQEFHSSHWGHLGLLGLRDHLLLPDYTAYPHTAAASPFPDNATVADWAHAQGALVGYVHPFDEVPDPTKEAKWTHALPIDLALGKVGYLEIVGFSDHRATAEVWYRLLNLGFRLPAAGGTDAMANHASLRGPVGLNRTFADTGGRTDADAFLGALKAGRTLATNAPLLGLSVEGAGPGGTVPGGHPVAVKVWLRSFVPVTHLELVANGTVVHRFPLKDGTRFDGEVTLPAAPGWMVLRAWSATPHPLLQDLYPYGTTSPVYLSGTAPKDPASARYFLGWIDKVMEDTRRHPGFNTEAERQAVLGRQAEARARFEALSR